VSIRQAPPRPQQLPSEPAGQAALPLRVLWERVRAPEAGRAEVDALLRGLSQPLGEGEAARERADLLLSLIEDRRVGSFKGSNGRRVRASAAEALMALGHPYALELPPEALDAMAQERRQAHAAVPDSPAPVGAISRQQVGLCIALGVALVEGVFLLRSASNGVGWLLFVLATLVGPAFVLVSETGMRNRLLHYACLTVMSLPFLMLLATGGVMWLMNGYHKNERTLQHFFPLSLALGHFVAMKCLHGRNPEQGA
jgi:hypothetical protein